MLFEDALKHESKAKITAEQENRERWEHEGRTKLGRNDMEL